MPVLHVYPRGTSRWAYDGSGKVRRAPGAEHEITCDQELTVVL
jgi:hypothetical protein